MKQYWNSSIKPFIWNTCEYIGLLIPNVVTSLWISYSKFSEPLGWLYLITVFGLVIQTLTFAHNKNLLTTFSEFKLLFLSIILLTLLLAMKCITNIQLFVIVYLLFFPVISLIIAGSVTAAQNMMK